MKKTIISLIIMVMLAAGSTPAFAATSDYELAKEWKAAHAKGGKITTLTTTAKGGYKGKVKGGGSVKYPKKVNKGKTVKVYLVFKKGKSECSAMVCLGVVK